MSNEKWICFSQFKLLEQNENFTQLRPEDTRAVQVLDVQKKCKLSAKSAPGFGNAIKRISQIKLTIQPFINVISANDVNEWLNC